MKLLSLLLLALTSLPALAERAPPNCGNACSVPMREVLDGFTNAGKLDTSLAPAVYSGECYHLGREYNPDHAHHGFVLVDTKENQYYMGGMFSFFSKENPYLTLTLEQAREMSPRRFNDEHRLQLLPTYAFADMNPNYPETPWMYWLRQDGNSFYALAQWGWRNQVFCRMQKNP